MRSLAIFRKDIKILIRQAGSALGVQAFLMLIVPAFYILMQILYKSSFPEDMFAYEWWFPQLQIAISVIIAFIVAAYWSVEEREGGHDRFLKRLPISALRLYGEKTAAGLFIVAATILIQYAWIRLFELAGMRLWNLADHPLFNLFKFTVLAYCIGLPVSRLVPNTVSVILVGIVLWFLVLWGYSSMDDTILLYLYDIDVLVVTLILILAILLFRWFNASRIERQTAGNLRLLMQLQMRQWENQLLFIVSILLFIVAVFLFPSHSFPLGVSFPLSMFAMLLSAAIGVCTYRSNEKDGMHCVLYHHPISRSEIYWSRFFFGLTIAILPALALVLFDPFMIIVEETFKRAYQGSRIIESLKEYSYTWHTMVFMIGFVPFCCGVLITHAIRHPVYAIMESILAIVFTLMTFYYLQINPLSHYFSLQIIYIEKMDRLLPPFSWTLFILLLGLVLAGLRSAMDRQHLTSNPGYKQIYIGRLFIFLAAVTFILVKIGWWDLFFLMTGIDVGIG